MMTMPAIIIKNIKYNFKKYLAYFIANSFIITAILMYGSLMYSDEFVNSPAAGSVKGNFYSVITLMVVFSVVFISYTTISFIRYRGKEFGVYLTMGITTKDLTRMLMLENLVVLSASFLTGAAAGTIFSRLFYMIIGKILWMDNLKPALSFKTYGLGLIITLAIFTINSIFQAIHIKKLSIIKLMKSSGVKEIGRLRILFGGIALIALIAALVLFPRVLKQEVFVRSEAALGIIIATIIVTPYFIIGSLLAIVNKVMKNFKSVYNNKLLVLSSLQHKFIAYKSVIYLVTILASAAIIFIGFSYSIYTTTEREISGYRPYDISFIENSSFNKISKAEIEKVVRSAGGEVTVNKTIEALNLRDYRVYEGMVELYGDNVPYFCASNYNKFMGTKVAVKKGSVVQLLQKNNNGKFKDSEMIICIKNPKDNGANVKNEEMTGIIGKDSVTKSAFMAGLENGSYIYVAKNQKSYLEGSCTNDSNTSEYYRWSGFILNDQDYARIKAARGESIVTYDHLIMLKDHKDLKSFESLYKRLKELNGYKDYLDAEFTYNVFKKEIRSNGFMLFSNAFMGIIFLIASGVVLYFKVLTGVSEDRERAVKLKQLSMTSEEIAKVFSKELRIVFMFPVILATGVVLFFFSSVFDLIQNGDYMFRQSLYVFAAYVASQLVFYFVTRGKYIRETVMN